MIKEQNIIAPESFGILVVSLLLTAAGFYLHGALGALLLVWTLFCVYFFRNPRRVCRTDPECLISPADGKVVFIGNAQEPHILKKDMRRISIFMSPFNVHVNRAPESGTVREVLYRKGNFRAAFDERASSENERSAVCIRTDGGGEIVFVQVAGWFARRIVNYAKAGDRLLRGQIFGLIKFSSRMDVYFSDDFEICVKYGECVKAGETLLARKPDQKTTN